MDINHYIYYDLPIPYKKITIYPVTVKDYLLFGIYSQCFSLEKNSIPDSKIISMTDLEYMYYSVQKKDDPLPHLIWFDRVLHLCLKDNEFENPEESMKRYAYDEKQKPFFTIRGEKYTSEDFDKIKVIICQQNLVELVDENISKEVRDSLEKAKEYKDKLSNVTPASFEDYIISLSMITGWTFDYVYSMSIRKFIKTLKRLDNYLHYKIYLSASMSGMVEFKDKSFIKHWLTNIDESDKYSDVSVDLSVIQDKISLESAKK